MRPWPSDATRRMDASVSAPLERTGGRQPSGLLHLRLGRPANLSFCARQEPPVASARGGDGESFELRSQMGCADKEDLTSRSTDRSRKIRENSAAGQ